MSYLRNYQHKTNKIGKETIFCVIVFTVHLRLRLREISAVRFHLDRIHSGTC